MGTVAAFVHRNARSLSDTSLVSLAARYRASGRLEIADILDREVTRRGLSRSQVADLLWLTESFATYGAPAD